MPLGDGGLADVANAAGVLAGLPPARLLSSSSLRARQTAAYLESRCGLSARSEDDLREIYLGEWQGLIHAEARARWPEVYAAWVAGQDVRRGGGETMAEVGARVARCLRAAVVELEPDEALVAVTHGLAARSAVGTLLEIPVGQWWRLGALGNARWATLVYDERGWRLGEYNAGVTEPVDAHPRGPAEAEPETQPAGGI